MSRSSSSSVSRSDLPSLEACHRCSRGAYLSVLDIRMAVLPEKLESKKGEGSYRPSAAVAIDSMQFEFPRGALDLSSVFSHSEAVLEQKKSAVGSSARHEAEKTMQMSSFCKSALGVVGLPGFEGEV